MSDKKKKRKRKYRIKKSILADAPIREINWRDWAPEFILLLPLLDLDDPIAGFQRLRDSVQRYSGKSFEGTVTSWQRVCSSDANAIAMIREENPQFFGGSNASLFAIFDFPTPTLTDSTSKVAATKKDVANLIVAYKRLDGPRTIDSTRAKALALWARSTDDLELQDVCAAVARSDMESASSVRARWNAWLTMAKAEPNVEWAAKILSWGMRETPCIVAPYEPPERPPWPITLLEPVAAATDTIYAKVIAVSNEPVADRVTGEVLSGLLARIRFLAFRIREYSAREEGLIVEILLRCLADTAVQVKWLLFKNDAQLYEQFQSRSHASEKGLLDDLRERMRAAGISSEAAEAQFKSEYANLYNRAGRWPELLDVVYGPWSDLSTSGMFKEISETDDGVTFTTWTRASDAVHGSWRSIEKYHMDECQNPFHIGHHVAGDTTSITAGVTPVISSIMIPLDVIYAYSERYPQLSGLGESVERQRIALVDWIRSHQRAVGSFDWHGTGEDQGTSPHDVCNGKSRRDAGNPRGGE